MFMIELNKFNKYDDYLLNIFKDRFTQNILTCIYMYNTYLYNTVLYTQ